MGDLFPLSFLLGPRTIRRWKQLTLTKAGILVGVTHEELDGILAEIKESHKHERLSTPEEVPVDISAEEITGLSGKESEKLDGAMKAVVNNIGLKQEALSEEEWTLPVKVVQILSRRGRGRREENSNI